MYFSMRKDATKSKLFERTMLPALVMIGVNSAVFTISISFIAFVFFIIFVSAGAVY